LHVDLVSLETELRCWLDEVGYASWDPYDGLSCGAPWSIMRRSRLAARAWTQFIKSSPINVRPLFGIRPRVLSKSLSDLASAALLRHRLEIDPQALSAAHQFLERLRTEVRPGFSGACWALATPYVTRYIDSGPNEPNLFWTLNAAVSFLEAYELEGRAADLELARSSVDFIVRDLGFVDEGDNGVWFRYFTGHDAVVYNVAALTGALLERVARHTGERNLEALGGRALRFVLRHQNADGSWYYARGSQGRWVDGFHTGYVLEALLQSARVHDRDEVRRGLQRGVEFYLQNMFTPEHLPRYTADSLYPIEVQNCAQAIQTLAKLCWLDRAFLTRAEDVTQAVVDSLYRRVRSGERPAGYFLTSRGRWFRNALPMVRWGEAPMLLALTYLLAARHGLPPSWEQTPARSGDARAGTS